MNSNHKVLMVPVAFALYACAEGAADGIERSWDEATYDGGVSAPPDGGTTTDDDAARGLDDGTDSVGADGVDGADDDGLDGDGLDGTADGTGGDGTLPPEDAGTMEVGDAGVSADAGTPDDPPDPFPMCPATSGCNAARQLPDFNGDDDNQPTLTTQGSGSEFVSVNVLEPSLLSVDLSVRFRLSGQADADYDLLVYDGCGASPTQGGMVGVNISEANLSWSDRPILDDARKLTVEVRHVSGQCSPWTLEVIKP